MRKHCPPFITLIALGIVLNAKPAQAAHPSKEKCDAQIANLPSITQLNFLYDCYGGYIREWEDPFFQSAIPYAARISELQIQDEPAFSEAFLLFYSRWAAFKRHDSNDPSLEGVFDAGLAFAKARFTDPRWQPRFQFYYSVAFELVEAAKRYDAKYFGIAEEYYLSAESLASLEQDFKQKVRLRLNIGSMYASFGKTEQAKDWFHKVLDIDPNNAVALKHLKDLGA